MPASRGAQRVESRPKPPMSRVGRKRTFDRKPVTAQFQFHSCCERRRCVMRKQAFTYLAGLVLAALSASAALSGPYANGRLVRPAFVEVAGSPQQIKQIKSYGLEHGWTVDCERNSASMATLRLRFAAGTSQSAIESYFDTDIRLPPRARTIAMIYDESRRSPRCGMIR